MLRTPAAITKIIISFIFIPFVANLVTFADDDEAIKTPPLCVSGIMFDEDNPLAVINGEVLGEGDTAGETRILKIKNSWVQFEYQGEVFNRELGEGCGKGVELPYRKDVKRNMDLEFKKLMESGIFEQKERRSPMQSIPLTSVMGGGLFFIVWLVMMAGMVVGYVILLASLWKGMKAHESIAQTLVEIAASLRTKV